jgi:hypothetical protein
MILFSGSLQLARPLLVTVGYLFEIQSHPHTSVLSFARQVVAHQWFI